MKVIIKTLKAPWPKGAKVGDIVSFDAETAPAWATGKYTLAPEGAEVDFQYEPNLAVPLEAAAPPQDPAEAKIAAALAAADEQARIELNDRVTAVEQALAAAKADLEASLSREASLQAALTDAQKLSNAVIDELEKARAQIAELQAQAAAPKSEVEPKPEAKTAKK